MVSINITCVQVSHITHANNLHNISIYRLDTETEGSTRFRIPNGPVLRA